MLKVNDIYKGDSYELIKQIDDKSIDLIYTDIPYLFENGGCGSSAISKRIQKLCNETLKDIRKGIDYSILDEFVRVMKYIYIYIWCSKEQIYDLMKYFIEEHNCRMNILVWCKTNPTPMTNDTWLPDIEYCLVFKEKGAKRYNDGYENKSKWFVSPINKADKDLYKHPTCKNIELVKRHLKHSVDKDMVVLDPFVGSGTTCVACKEIGCKYIGFEINEEYYKIAKDRLNGINQKGEMSLFETDFEQLDLFGGNENE